MRERSDDTMSMEAVLWDREGYRPSILQSPPFISQRDEWQLIKVFLLLLLCSISGQVQLLNFNLEFNNQVYIDSCWLILITNITLSTTSFTYSISLLFTLRLSPSSWIAKIRTRMFSRQIRAQWNHNNGKLWMRSIHISHWSVAQWTRDSRRLSTALLLRICTNAQSKTIALNSNSKS